MKTTITIAFLMLATITSCSRKNDPQTVVFTSTHVQKFVNNVTPETKAISHRFEFRVWGKQAVTVKGIHTSCSCVTASRDLVGRLLEPNTTNYITCSVNPEGRSGLMKAIVIVETEPASSKPILLTLELLIATKPVFSPNPLFLKTKPLSNARVMAKVIRVRHASLTPLELDEDAVDFGPFELINQLHSSIATRQDIVGEPSLGITDEIVLELVCKNNLPIGVHPFELEIPWVGEPVPTRVDGQIQVLHPVRASVDRLFCELGSKEAKQLSVGLEFGVGTHANVVEAIECDLKNISAKFDSADESVMLEIDSIGLSPGRLEGEVKIRFQKASLPDLRIPISILIKN